MCTRYFTQRPRRQHGNQVNCVANVLPQPPVPAFSAMDDPSSVNNPEHSGSDGEHSTTLPDAFYVHREYLGQPSSIPDMDCQLEDYSNKAYENPTVTGPGEGPTDSVRQIIFPCPNMSAFLIQRWHWTEGHQKTQESRDSLIKNVLLHPDFSVDDIRDVNWSRLDSELGKKQSTGLLAGWNSTPLRLKVPAYTSNTSSYTATFETPPLHFRRLMDVVTDAFSSNDPKHFFYDPFRLCYSRPGEPHQRLHGELYCSDAMLRAHEEVQKLPPEPGCALPRSVAALMFSSDGAAVAQFSTTSIHPVYLFFGNQSKYERCKPTSHSCYDVAHVPPVGLIAFFAG